MKFSENISELDNILKKLENGDIPLEDALSDFERGIKLIKECRKFLNAAEQKITILTDNGEEPMEKVSK